MSKNGDDFIKIIPIVTAPSQNLCISCGMCCDGTLFVWAPLCAEDKAGQLDSFTVGDDPQKGGPHFDLPCPHLHDRKCALYQSWRPRICHTFRCKTLRRFEAGEIDLLEAQTIIERTTELATRVWRQMGERVGDQRGSLGALFLSWKASIEKTDPDWMENHAGFLTDFYALQYRLDKGFRQKGAQSP